MLFYNVIELVLNYKNRAERLNKRLAFKGRIKRREIEIQRDIALDNATRVINQFPNRIPQPYIDWIIGTRKNCPDLKEVETWQNKKQIKRQRRILLISFIIVLVILMFYL